jgi:hypothetical protein
LIKEPATRQPSLLRNEDAANLCVIFEEEIVSRKTGTLDLLSKPFHLIQYNQDIEIGIRSGFAAGIGAVNIDTPQKSMLEFKETILDLLHQGLDSRV